MSELQTQFNLQKDVIDILKKKLRKEVDKLNDIGKAITKEWQDSLSDKDISELN